MNTPTNPVSTSAPRQSLATAGPRLTTLHDGRPGLRTLLPVEVRSPTPHDAAACALEAGHPSILDFISSTDTLDRYNEIIDPSGWRLEAYRRNPVFQNAHNYGNILFTLGKALVTEVRQVRGAAASGPPSRALYQRIQFATDVNPIARIAFGLYKGGFLNAVSVGFVPLRWEEPKGTNGAPTPRRRYLEQELLEVSAVAIPANPDALALAVKSGGVPKSALRDTLDLLRALTVDYGPWSPPSCVSHLSTNPAIHLSASLDFARTLRNILKHT